MIDVWYVIVIIQLIVSLYLTWKVHSLAKEVDDTQIVLGGVLYEMSQYEDYDEEETRH
jgi:hypothetical protein